MDGRLTITDVAKYLGVTPRTIMRWERAGKIKKTKRDWRGWRFYLKTDLEEIRRFYESTYEYNEDRRNAMDLTKITIAALLMATASFTAGMAYAQTEAAKAAAQDRPAYYTETKTTVDVNLNSLPVVVTASPTSEEALKYTLGPDDVIMIEVRRHPEFSGEYTVNSEGKIEYKFVGDITVDGLTKNQLREKLTGILSEFVVGPEIDVRIMQYLSKVFYVVGEVNRPGKFYMKGNSITVREALVQAGLLNQAAAPRKCRLITPDRKGRNKYVNVNAYELLYAGDLSCNLDMKPGDVLYVPATVMAKVIRVVSPVTNAVSEAAGAAAAGAGTVAIGL